LQLPARNCVHPDDNAKLDRIFAQAIRTQHGWQNELIRFRHKDGSYRSLESSASPMFDTDGKLVGFQGMDRDVTERLAAAAELKAAKCAADKANRAKSHFLAAASHDLRQPLSALSLYIGVLKAKIDPEHDALVGNIKDCVGTLSILLNDLLDVSKLEAGVVTPNIADVSLETLLTPLVSIHSVKAAQKGLLLRWRQSNTAVHTDGQLLHRILGNLIANAVRYTEQGGVLIACRRHNNKHWLEIWDTGIGIPEDKTELIFEEYQQLGNPDGLKKGSGLGLAIVAKAAKLLNLEIRLKSREGRGTLFAVELPPASYSDMAVEKRRISGRSK
jgi:hypothetical protein